MTPKKLSSFRLGPIDIIRLKKLAQKKEQTEAAIVREAIRRYAEAEGIKIK